VSSPNGGIKLTLDVAIGETSALEGGDKEKLQDLATRVRDLNARLNDIRREQVFQRVGYPPPFCHLCSRKRY
jgi:outer membrane murein-binding lipoprotein Lpp